MSLTCSFYSAGIECDSSGIGESIVPLLSCVRDTSGYLAFRNVEPDIREWELILNRARYSGLDFAESDLDKLTVCPHHRSVLTTSFNIPHTCVYPNHNTVRKRGKSKGLGKNARRIGKSMAGAIFTKIGHRVPICGGICDPCRLNWYKLCKHGDEELQQPPLDDQPTTSTVLHTQLEHGQQQRSVHFRLDDVESIDSSIPSTSQTFVTPEGEAEASSTQSSSSSSSSQTCKEDADVSSSSSNDDTSPAVAAKVVSSTPFQDRHVATVPFIASASEVSAASDDGLPHAKRPRLSLRSDSSSQTEGEETEEEDGSHSLWLNQTMEQQETRGTINLLLKKSGFGELKSTLNTDWSDLHSRQQLYYTSKVRDCIKSVLSQVVPGQENIVWDIVRHKPLVGSDTGPVRKTKNIDEVQNLISAYHLASPGAKMQILSLFANDFSKSQLQQSIPGLTIYKIDKARKHATDVGQGELVPHKKITRMRLDQAKVDHFIDFLSDPKYIQDVAFGTRSLTLDSGDKLVVPNIIRTVIPSRIIKQYQDYCQEMTITPLSERTLFRIVEVCGASQQQSLQGLDYISADGAEAFETLQKLVQDTPSVQYDKLVILGQLKAGKRYFKSELPGHCQRSCACASHCITFSLSDNTNGAYASSCDHAHDRVCTSCDDLAECICVVKSLLDTENRENMHDFDQAVDAITSWQAHIVRAVQQDQSKHDALQSLDQSTVLIVMDWAMKFLPAYFRERMTHFFGKRGISWHVTCVISRKEDLEVKCFVHVFDQVTQNWEAITCILEHTLSVVKETSPLIEKASIRSDNAGCYHNSMLLSELPRISRTTGVSITSYNFSETQHGKDVCDRKIAPLKRHMKLFIDENNDITTANEMKRGMESHGGVAGCSVYECEIKTAPQRRDEYTLTGISHLHNFSYETEGQLRAWKAYDIGEGALFSLPEVEQPPATLTVKEAPSTEATVRPYHASTSKTSTRMYVCSKDGCHDTFLTQTELNIHLEEAQHQDEEDDTVYDSIRKKWAKKITSISDQATSSLGGQTTLGTTSLTRGWALKTTRRAPRMSKGVKDYLTAVFDEGAKTGVKANPFECARTMRAKFGEGEWRTAKQIASFFSRVAAERKRPGLLQNGEDDEEALAREVLGIQLRAAVAEEVDIQHPVVIAEHNLCEMFDKNSVEKLTVKTLKMCCQKMNLESVSFKRKADYVNGLKSILSQCSCHSSCI